MKWEYKTIKIETAKTFGGIFTGSNLDNNDLEQALNQAGNDGWELVSTTNVGIAIGKSSVLILVLKRKKVE